MDAFQVESGHLADFEAPNTDYQPRCDSRSIEFEPILLPFHSTSHYEDQVDRVYRIVPRKALIEPVQPRMPPRGVLFCVAFGHLCLFFAGRLAVALSAILSSKTLVLGHDLILHRGRSRG